MKNAKIEATGPPVALGFEVQKQADGTILARLPELPGIYFHGKDMTDLAHKASATVSLLTVAAKMTGTTLEKLWNGKTDMVEVEIIGEGTKDGRLTFTGGKH